MTQRYAAIIVLAIILSLAGGMMVVVKPWENKAAQYDKKTFCPKNEQYARTAILIDATDSLNEATAKSVVEHILNLVKNDLKLYEWVGVFVLQKDFRTPLSPEIALCNPGNENTCNPLFSNCKDAGLEFRKKFEEPMKQKIRNLTDLPTSDSSPILEMIQAVALDREFNSSQERRLIIISDMLQNTPGKYSHYKDGIDYTEWKKSDYAKQFLQLSLTGVKVTIWSVHRPKNLQTQKHVIFWNQYFAATGASIEEYTPL